VTYRADTNRYHEMVYRRCGQSGLCLPAISFGFWHNFGEGDPYDNARAMTRRAFDLGITHFDLANIYGPPAGAAEAAMGRLLTTDFASYRDELVISTKAGYDMGPGPYGEWGSRKHLTASLDQSLQRMKLDYVDIFYSHRPDLQTPMEETMEALVHAIRVGKALYVGISNHLLVHQPEYSLLNRWIEDGLQSVLDEHAVGCVVYSPLAQGLLTDRYLAGIPTDSRAAKASGNLALGEVKASTLRKVRNLQVIASRRGQSIAQMALAWVLSHQSVTSAIIGASRVNQIEDNVRALNHIEFSREELQGIKAIIEA